MLGVFASLSFFGLDTITQTSEGRYDACKPIRDERCTPHLLGLKDYMTEEPFEMTVPHKACPAASFRARGCHGSRRGEPATKGSVYGISYGMLFVH